MQGANKEKDGNQQSGAASKNGKTTKDLKAAKNPSNSRVVKTDVTKKGPPTVDNKKTPKNGPAQVKSRLPKKP